MADKDADLSGLLVLCTPQAEDMPMAIPSAVFYDDHPEAGRTLVRFAFCKRPEVVKEALSRLSVLAR